MPLEQKRKIEELLEAYAKRRREQAGAPLELTPVTRAFLQGEMARKFPVSSQARSNWQTWAWLWPRLVVAGGLAALALLVFLPSLMSTKTKGIERVAQVAQPAAAPVPAQPPRAQSRLREDVYALSDARNSEKAKDEVPTESRPPTELLAAPSAPPTPVPRRDLAKNVPMPVDKLEQQKPDTRFAEVPVNDRDKAANVSPSMAFKSQATTASTVLSMQFQQKALFGKDRSDSKSTPQVLTSFTVERNGNNVRVVDQDGSVYEGQITDLLTTKSPQVVGGLAGRPAPTGGTFGFQVSGTNKVLQQNVLFTGSLTQVGVEATNQKGASTLSGATVRSQSQIAGQVQIGSTNAFPINAAQTK